MKWIHTLTALTAMLGMSATAQAGLFSFGGKCGAEKSSGCAPTCQPRCCKPTIQRPCEGKTFTYQRACSTLTQPNCKPDCCAPKAPSKCAPACGPNGSKCAPACGPKGADCAAPDAGKCAPACGPNGSKCAPACGPKGADCAAPDAGNCAPACAPKAACGPKASTCAAPCASKCAPACDKNGSKCAPACGPKDADCAAPNAGNCAPKCGSDKPCCGDERNCCDDDPCEIAELIYESQTACYAKDRRRAIDRLGDRYDCRCNPEIMAAFGYALNDCDERVRAEAADEIGDQVRRHGCCCMCDKIVAALTCALADCDRKVRHEAEEALEACGYEIVDCCKPKCGANGCTSDGGCTNGGCKPAGPACDPNCNAPMATPAEPAPMPAPGGDAAPAPAPPEEKSARSLFPTKRRSKLANLFGLLN